MVIVAVGENCGAAGAAGTEAAGAGVGVVGTDPGCDVCANAGVPMINAALAPTAKRDSIVEKAMSLPPIGYKISAPNNLG